MADAHHAISDAGGFDARPRAQAMLLGLGFKSAELDAPVNSFSGGWRMRLQLARALMCPADLMLLDEPTNHLDLDALVWLEAWLQRYAGTMIVISHDREFLDAITKVTLHLDETKLIRYTGNYSAFEEMRPIRLAQAQASYEKQQERMAHLQKFIDRFKAKASKAKQAQSRVKALARMEKLGAGADQRRLPVRVPRAAEPAEPDARLRRRRLRLPLRRSSARSGSSTASTARCSPASASASSAPTARASRRWSRRSSARCRRWPATITAGKGLTIGYFAQQELDVLSPADGAADAHGAARARLRPGRRASRSCATSSARSASSARWWRSRSARSPAARRRGWCWRCWSGSGPTCCCSTSRPTTST